MGDCIINVGSGDVQITVHRRDVFRDGRWKDITDITVTGIDKDQLRGIVAASLAAVSVMRSEKAGDALEAYLRGMEGAMYGT